MRDNEIAEKRFHFNNFQKPFLAAVLYAFALLCHTPEACTGFTALSWYGTP